MKPPEGPGGGLLRVSRWCTAVFVAAAIAAVIDPERLSGPLVAVSLTLFAAGVIGMLMAFARAVERSRAETIGIGGLFFGAGSAPAVVRRELLGALAVQVAVGLTAAGIRVFTAVAFATLVPTFGIAMMGLWCARHGVFEPRKPSPSKTSPEPPDERRPNPQRDC